MSEASLVPLHEDASGGDGSSETPAGCLRILLIEDNRDMADTLQELLGLAGHDVSVTGSGEEGLKMAEKLRPHLVLCDLGLPGMPGYEVARRARSHPALKGTPFIALSGYGRDEDRRRSIEAGFRRHVTKPLLLDDLDELVAEFIRDGAPEAD